MGQSATQAGVQPQRTHPLSFAVKALQGLQNALFPMVAVYVSLNDKPWAIVAALALGLLIGAMTAALSYLSWRRLTYTVGEQDIRVESGILARAARSVPFERIQDVSLEQKLIPRLLGLVQVRFETGAGGKDELSLSYLSEAEGERLRDVIKARKDGELAVEEHSVAPEAKVVAAPADRLFSMDEKRLFTFGLFEFSLAVFAVLAGLFQYAETFVGIEIYDPGVWQQWFAGPGSWLSALGPVVQIVGIVSGLVSLVIVGSITGLVRTFLRDWGFVLERNEKGFRRRRGLFTRTDVVMPVHRVQAITVTTGFIRRQFGWYGLKFISLAQDSGSASHDVAPFAKMAELAPIARAAGFEIEPAQSTRWHRGSRKFRIDNAILSALFLGMIACGVAAALFVSHAASPGWASLIFLLGAMLGARELWLWRFDFNALDPGFLFMRRGWLAPRRDVASRIKLQSVEIAQGPIARIRGYATLKLGLAGGTFSLEGIPLERARELRGAILKSIARTDFSQLSR